MKKMRFKELVVISLLEKSARKINLNADVTIITSKENDTGKSQIIKSIYYALGASPYNVHPEWKKIKPLVFLRFEKDGIEYQIMRSESVFSLFDRDGHHLNTFTSIGNGLTPFYEDFFDFRLKLVHSTSLESKTPFPSHYFLPFYIDQDAGWKRNWSSFDNLSFFKGWRKDLIEYHTGIRPNKYYELKTKKIQAQDNLKTKVEEKDVIERVYNKTLKDTETTNLHLNIDIANFKQDIDELVKKLNELSALESKYRTKLMTIYNQVAIIDAQISLVQSTKQELQKDFEYAERIGEEIECPTCGTIHTNTFEKRYLIAQDEDHCYQLLLEMEQEKGDLKKKIRTEQAILDEHLYRKNEIQEILHRKREQIRLKDYIDSVGQKSVVDQLKKELRELEYACIALNDSIKEITRQMKAYDNPEHNQGINEKFMSFMRESLHLLDVQKLFEKDYQTVAANIIECGSDLSRALLAYYYSILRVMELYSSSYLCPMVIDSPLQDEQSIENRLRILKFIRDKKPVEMQLILSCVGMDELSIDDSTIRLNGVEFNNVNIVEFTEKYHALSTEAYPKVFEEYKKYIDILMEAEVENEELSE